MSKKTFTLDSFRAAAETKYAATFVEVDNTDVELVNPLRLPKAKRDKLQSLFGDLKAEGAAQEEVLGEIIELVAKVPSHGKKLTKAIDGDLAVLLEVVNAYGEETQAGEASPSQG